jgi:DNA-binding XRE family transcriptional regulator
MNKLKLYLFENGIKVNHFAKKCNVCISTISQIANGKMLPSLKLALTIQRLTHNEVQPNDFFPPYSSNAIQPAPHTDHPNQTQPILRADFNPYASETTANLADLNTSALNDIAKGFNSYVSNTITPDICLNSCITKIDASLTNLDPSILKTNASLTDLNPSASDTIASLGGLNTSTSKANASLTNLNPPTSDAATPGTCSDIDIANIDPDITNPKIKEAVNG